MGEVGKWGRSSTETLMTAHIARFITAAVITQVVKGSAKIQLRMFKSAVLLPSPNHLSAMACREPPADGPAPV
jgi:hypothetical protein